MDRGNNSLKLKRILRMDFLLQTGSFSILKTLIDGLELITCIIVFISCLDSHSDGTYSLQRIHWWASDVMLNFSKSVLMKTVHLGWYVIFQQTFIFGWTVPLIMSMLHFILNSQLFWMSSTWWSGSTVNQEERITSIKVKRWVWPCNL